MINFAQLAKTDAQRPQFDGPLLPGLMPEPQEKAEPNARTTLPSPFPAPLSVEEGTSNVPSPSPVSSFIAQADAVPVGTLFSYITPDTNGAVGQSKLMSTLNNNYRIQDKATGAVLSTVAMTTFRGSVGAAQPFDPKTHYDPYTTAGSSPRPMPRRPARRRSYTASPTRPTLGYLAPLLDRRRQPEHDLGRLPDRRLQHDHAYAGIAKLYVIDCPALRANTAAAGTPSVINVTSGFTIQPAVTYSATENTMYLVEHGVSSLGTYYFYTLTGTTLMPVGGTISNPLGAWTVPGSANVLPQSGGNPIDAGDSRILNAVYRNGNIYYAQTIGLPAGLTPGTETGTAVQWVEINTSGVFVQGGRIEDATATNANGGHWYAYPSIAVNSSSDVLLGFSESQSNDFADAAYALRFGADAAGTMREPVTLKDGEGNYKKTFTGLANRWGDWSTWWGKVLGSGAPPTTFQFGVTTSGTGAGSVTSSPAGINCGAANVIFAGWGGACSGTGACNVTMSAAQSVTARFNRKLTPPSCVVPNVIGKKLGAASALIKAKHCRVGKLTYIKSTKKRKGKVIKEQPAPGKRLANNAKVNLWIGKGPKR